MTSRYRILLIAVSNDYDIVATSRVLLSQIKDKLKDPVRIYDLTINLTVLREQR